MLRKGVLDSALAANYMVSCEKTGVLRLKTLLQRSDIYRKLGWDTEVARLIDTIRASREYRRAVVMPEIELGISSGMGTEKQTADTTGPWGTGSENGFSHRERGVFGRLDVQTTWKLNRCGRGNLKTGLAGSVFFRRFSTHVSFSDVDSADMTGSVFASLSGNSLSSTASLSVNRRIDDSIFLGGGIEGGLVGKGSWLPMLWSGSSMYITPSGRFGNSRIWLFASAQKKPAKRLRTDYNCFINSHFEKPSSAGFIDTLKKLYAEDGGRPYPVFYTDGSFSAIIDTSRLSVISGELLNRILNSGRDTTLHVGLKQPFSNILINPRIALQVEWRFPVQLGISWKWNFFLEKHEWDQIPIPVKYLIYSRSNDAFYVIPKNPLTTVLTPTFVNGTLATVPPAQRTIHHSVRRIDNTASVDLSIHLYKGSLGSMSFTTCASNTWSTLHRKAPVEIPEWTFSGSFEWRLKIRNKMFRY